MKILKKSLSKETIKFKLNLTIIFSILFIATFIYYNGDKYFSNILKGNNPNIVALNIPISFENNNEENNEENSKVENILYNPQKNQISNQIWHWPTTNNYIITTNYSYSHKALDIYSYDGYNSNIYAANKGEIIEIKDGCIPGNIFCNGRGGNYIIIKHDNNYYTIYMHLNKIKVHTGDIVQSGDIIATMGNTGNVIPIPTPNNPYGGTHLHFCLYIGRPFQEGYPIDPYKVYN